MGEALTSKYRPQVFGDVVGHDSVVRSLQNALKKGTARAYLFTGPSGLGKTTLARIAAKEVGCQPQDLMEIDAATYTGIDDMRAVTANLHYKPLGEGTVKVIIIDEAHALSKQAFQSLLKILEEPPAWVYWFLCTTEPTRILPTIRTRCFQCDLKPVGRRDLIELLEYIAAEEKLRGPQGYVELCAKESGGSPRQALANLVLCSSAKTMDEVRQLLRSAEASSEAVELARALTRGAGWMEIQGLLVQLQDTNPESVRHVVRAYVTKVVLGAKSERSAGRGLEILDAFSQPFNSSDGVSPLVMACGRAVLS